MAPGTVGRCGGAGEVAKNSALQSNSSSFIDTDEGAVIAGFYRGDVPGFSGQLEDETFLIHQPEDQTLALIRY